MPTYLTNYACARKYMYICHTFNTTEKDSQRLKSTESKANLKASICLKETRRHEERRGARLPVALETLD